jgi:hypothetical protein
MSSLTDHLRYIIYQLQPGERHGIRLIIEYHTGDGHKTDILGQDINPEHAGRLASLLALALLNRPFEVQGLTAKPDSHGGPEWTIYDQEGGELRQVGTPGQALRLMLTDGQRARWEAPALSIEYPCLYD